MQEKINIENYILSLQITTNIFGNFFQVKAFLQKSCLSLALKTLRAFAFCEPLPEELLKPMITSKFAFVPGKPLSRGMVQTIFLP
jgi:hypothetical protein